MLKNLIFFGFAGWLTYASAVAGDFAVSPIRLDFDRLTKTGVITISNDGDDNLQIQMKAFEWTQDAEGKDQYQETDDLIFFPKIATVAKGEKRLLRTSYKFPATERQKTYRLFIEEIPGPQKSVTPGAQITVAVRFGVPIFLKPLVEEVKGEVEDVKYADNKLKVTIRNSGNTHFFINSIQIKNADVVSDEQKGWYLLAGAQRTYEFALKRPCSALRKFAVNVKSDAVEFNRSIDALACNP